MNGPGSGTSGLSVCFFNDISVIGGTGTISVGSSGPSHNFRSYFHQSCQAQFGVPSVVSQVHAGAKRATLRPRPWGAICVRAR